MFISWRESGDLKDSYHSLWNPAFTTASGTLRSTRKDIPVAECLLALGTGRDHLLSVKVTCRRKHPVCRRTQPRPSLKNSGPRIQSFELGWHGAHRKAQYAQFQQRGSIGIDARPR